MFIDTGDFVFVEVEFPARQIFAPIEWLVIAMGAGPISNALTASRSGREVLAFAQEGGGPCLETLRRTAHLAKRCGWGLPSAEVGVFLRAGWSEEQLEALIESVLDALPDQSDPRVIAPRSGETFGGASIVSRAKSMEVHV